MAKNALKIILISATILFCACKATSPTYSRKEISQVIQKICKDEFNISVRVWDKDNTLWLYAPFSSLLDDKNALKETVNTDIRNIFLSLKRVLLSMDTPPEFYAFVISDIEKIGADVLYIGYVPDMVKFEFGLISLGEFQEREVFLNFMNPAAVGDNEGNHIQKYPITLGDFIALLAEQQVSRAFTAPEMAEKFKVISVRSNYYNGKIDMVFNIEHLSNDVKDPSPFDEAEKAIKKYLKMYNFENRLTDVEIINNFDDTKRYYTHTSFFEKQ